jgi:hypothetical protein
LGDYGPAAFAAVPALIDKLGCTHTNTFEISPNIMRYYAATALGKIGPGARDAVPALHRALNDPSPAVREEAAKALYQITGRPKHSGTVR